MPDKFIDLALLIETNRLLTVPPVHRKEWINRVFCFITKLEEIKAKKGVLEESHLNREINLYKKQLIILRQIWKL